MQNQNIIQQISMAIAAALLVDLPDIFYRAWTPGLRKLLVPADEAPLKHRRPFESDIDVMSFPQTWGSTALGHGGIGGAAMTTAQTTVVSLRAQERSAAVYFGERLGYVVLEPDASFFEDLRLRQMAPKSDATRYGLLLDRSARTSSHDG